MVINACEFNWMDVGSGSYNFTINESPLPVQFAIKSVGLMCSRWVRCFDVVSLNTFTSNWEANASANLWIASVLGIVYFDFSKLIFANSSCPFNPSFSLNGTNLNTIEISFSSSEYSTFCESISSLKLKVTEPFACSCLYFSGPTYTLTYSVFSLFHLISKSTSKPT